MKKSNNIISDWLDKYGDPEIEKKVELELERITNKRYNMNKLDKDYQALLQDILDNGHKKGDRTGTGTISVYGRQIRHNMKDGFPLLTTKKMYTKGIITELLWFLRGDTNIKFLLDNDCHIWDGDAYKSYCNKQPEYWKDENGEIWHRYSKEEFINKIKTDDEFANKWGELGPIYGKQWREWTYLTREQKRDIDGIDEEICGADMWDGIRHYRTFDQIANSLNLLKTDPDSRRNKVSAWNVGEMDQMTLPPCHTDFQFYTRELSHEERMKLLEEKHPLYYMEQQLGGEDILTRSNIPTRAISLMWNQRSVDTFLGLPFNIASYGLLLEIIAKAVNMVPEELIGNLGDVHLYSNHIEQAKEQIGRELDKIERVNYGVDILGYESLLDYGHSQDEDELITKLCDEWGVPKRTREPYALPTLKINSGNENWHLLDIDDIVQSLDTDITFKLENYQSHPTIKAPLSN